MKQIRIGTIVEGAKADRLIRELVPHGFESFAISFWQTTGETDLVELAKRVKDALGDSGAVISTVGVYGNPLTGHAGNHDTLASWERLIDTAHLFGAGIVSGFTGRIPDRSIDGSIPKFQEVFGELAKRAEDRGLKIAFENCDMGGTWRNGDWNIAHDPTAWEMLFNAVPGDNLGLQWEPCHQMVRLIDPIPQLRKWVPKIFNVHGKDATIAWDIVKEYGIHGQKEFVWHRTPGFGDSNWTDIISILRQQGYEGTIDIEGYHDPIYRDEWELTGQLHALRYLKNCRGGEFVPNPEV